MNFIILIYIVKLLAIQTVLSIGINISDILYHYALLCGASGEDLDLNPSFLPFSSNNLGVCPRCCDDNKICRVEGNCCPGLDLKYPPIDCVDSILYPFKSSTIDNDKFNEKYQMIQTCPEGFDASLIQDAEKCSGYSENLFDLTQNVPVTDVDTFLTFRNRHCAKCNGVKKYIPWQIDVKCDRTFEPSLSLEDLVSFTLENNCTMRSIPVYTKTKVCDDQKLINECNVTGTWTKYNKNIDYACRTLLSPFYPYKNVFCYICNPPKQFPTDMTVKTCSKDHFYNKSMVEVEIACEHGGKSEATYPYQNIYCYMCNSKFKIDTHVRPYSTEIDDSGIITYRLIDTNVYEDDEIYEGYIIPHLKTCLINYAKVKTKFECDKIIPIGLFSINATEDIIKYHEDSGCNMTDLSYRENMACEKNEIGNCYNKTIMDVHLACETNDRNTFFIGEGDRDEKLFIISPCSKPSYVLLSTHDDTNNCWNILQKDKKHIYPIETSFCHCMYAGTNQSIVVKPLTIFKLDYYSENCGIFQVYDPIINRCRATGCFAGKQFRYSRCDTILPMKRYNEDLQYRLPLSFISYKSGENVTELLRNFSFIKLRMEIEFCLMKANENDTSPEQIGIISVKDVTDLVSTELKLTKLVYFLLTEPFENVHIDYYYWSNPQNATKTILTTCGDRIPKIPTVTDLLTCRHVLFLRHEYIVADKHQVYIPMYESKLNFYEYEIDGDNNLRICVERFETLISDLRNKISVYTIVMIVCTSVSLLCLLITFVTYCVFPSLQTLPGKNIMNLVLSLFLYHTFYMVLMMIRKFNDDVCRFVGIMTHFFMLCCFGSFTVCTVHMYRIFGQTKLSSSVMGIYDKRLFFIYTFSVYGSSAIVVAIHVVVSYVISGMVSVGYGRNGKCFVSSLNGFIVTVLIPLVLTFIVNFTLYTITAHRLKKKVKVTAKLTNNTKENKKEMWILAKLFITTGCSWILLLINFIVDDIFIYVAISGLNTLQGVFIFFAYICSKRIFNMYKTKLFGHSEMPSPRSNSRDTKATYILKHSTNEQDINEDMATRSDLKTNQTGFNNTEFTQF